MLALVLGLLIVSLSGCKTTTPEPKTVIFNDTVLEARIRVIMNKPTGDILISEAETVENLDLAEANPSTPSARIIDISALKYFTHLKGLNLSYQNVEDLSPLADLIELEVLAYWGAGSVTNFSGLANLTNMLDINLSNYNEGIGSNFTDADLAYLADMPNLQLLTLQGAKITDLSPLANLSKLRKLNIDYSDISDLSPISEMTSLVEMDLRYTNVSDLSPLENLVNLQYLWLEGCPITDYSPLVAIYPNLVTKDFSIE